MKTRPCGHEITVKHIYILKHIVSYCLFYIII